MHKYNLIIKSLKILAVVYITFYFFGVAKAMYLADVNYVYAQRSLTELDLTSGLKYADKAIELNPLEPNYYRMRARIYINFLSKEDSATKPLLKKLILKDLATAYNINPQNLVTIRNIIPLYYFVAAKNILLPDSEQNIDPDFIKYAKDFYALNKFYSPNDVGIFALLAKYEKRLFLVKEYNESYAMVNTLRPDLLDWYESFR